MKSLLIFAIGTVFLFGISSEGYSQKLKEKINKKIKGIKGNKLYINELEQDVHTNLFDNLCTPNKEAISTYVKDHRHQIMFSSEELGMSDESGLVNDKGETEVTKTTFSINDPIYFNIITFYGPQRAKIAELTENGDYYDGVYFDAKTNKWGKDDGTKLGVPVHNGGAEILVKIYIDGKLIKDEVCDKKFQIRAFSYGFISIQVHDIKENMESTCWKTLMSSLSEGEHTLKVEMYPYDDRVDNKKGNFSTKYPMATGECKIVRKVGEVFSISYGKTWKEYFVAANNSNLEKTVLASAKKRKSNITDTKLTSTWRIIRNELTGAILKRYCTAAFLYKTDKGDCEVIEYEFIQEYFGNKFQGEIKMNYSREPFSLVTNQVTRIDCK